MLRPLLAVPLAAAVTTFTVPGQSLPAFHSPSGNIGCIADDSSGHWELRCDVGQRNWEGPRPRGCDLDSGDAVGLSASGRPYWICHGDTALGEGRVLEYGSTWGAGPFTCTSSTAGVTCRNRAGHGFFLSRQSYRLF
jgi:hypothetical protein